ncbi:MAG: mandelate racemase/muconate lactonizing enzyme family protein [Rhodobacter sp.]|nr:mandelate racemase/muconate lactonizing enzyme family protein [Rhodobacter sp.]MCA3494452.1 mandelate racemase/muconate lactonizing enzyme family protein [Rhodobacter sp.]MCA3500259.1 mandelate racemase/muconate lactonizing enzyme family protein [Rhodobacter sp.]MCA3504986.1 mandelate racemase/muconate lactonizing enzyme family protein [Rhodobacter sp.]MCA3518100.1 mandelate racemase/muconate lactonizing enzyme family protein [Rhodobacter sp.]
MSRIVRLETFHNEFVCFVRATAEDGAFGWGQTSTYNADITAQVFHRQIVPWALGADASDIGGLVRLIERREHKFPGSYRARALAGLDTALWDMAGRRAGKPVASLIGGAPGPVRAYASSMKRNISAHDEAERLVCLCAEQGFTAAKWRIGAECGEDTDEWPGRTEEIIPVVSRALGDGIDKLVDANSGFSVARAITVGRMLEDNGIGHYEEPVPYWDLEATRDVTLALEIDVTGGEQDWDMATWKRMIDMRAVDVVQPDVMYVGGLSRTLEVARMAQAAGLPCTPHAANLSLVTMCTMHLLTAIPNAGKYLELSIEGDDYYPWQRDLFVATPYAVAEGHVTVSDLPGWGVEISPAWLDRSVYTEAAVESFSPSAYGALYHKGGKP